MTHGRRIPPLMPRQFINSRLSCSFCLFATNSESDPPIDLLGEVEIAEFRILDCVKSKVKIFLFSISRLNLSIGYIQFLLSQFLSSDGHFSIPFCVEILPVS